MRRRLWTALHTMFRATPSSQGARLASASGLVVALACMSVEESAWAQAAAAPPSGDAKPTVTAPTPAAAPALPPAAPSAPVAAAPALMPPPVSSAPAAGTAPAATASPPPSGAAAPAPRRPASNGAVPGDPSEVFSEDWWTRSRPSFEFHGYYRVRTELFSNFSLGRTDDPASALWPQPAGNAWSNPNTRSAVKLCGSASALEECQTNTQIGANMRLRLNPELHVSDNVRFLGQLDLLDNLVMGSTPEGLVNSPSGSGYSVAPTGGYVPLGVYSSTQWSPIAGSNSPTSSINVKRAFGEYVTPLGTLRFGRMANHWGLGMLANGGDTPDSDYSTNVDRLMFITGLKNWDLYFSAAVDFVHEGPVRSLFQGQQGQSYDASQLDDVNQYVFTLARRRDPQLQKLDLARGNVVLNGGLYLQIRNQELAVDQGGAATALGASNPDYSTAFVHRGAQLFVPDLWFQLLYGKLRFEAEGSAVYGDVENTLTAGGSGTDYVNPVDSSANGWKVRQFGLATQTEYRVLEDRVRLQFGSGWASGDPDAASLVPQGTGLQPQLTSNRTDSTFRFHPDYRVDLILFRNILSRVQGAYYFKPEASYDFLRDKSGQRLGGSAAVIWSRASEFIQAPGHARDLGVELDLSLYFQAKDGVLNDDLEQKGGFYSMIQYGVLFPLSGLDYLPGQVKSYQQAGLAAPETSAAQILRWWLGVLF